MQSKDWRYLLCTHCHRMNQRSSDELWSHFKVNICNRMQQTTCRGVYPSFCLLCKCAHPVCVHSRYNGIHFSRLQLMNRRVQSLFYFTDCNKHSRYADPRKRSAHVRARRGRGMELTFGRYLGPANRWIVDRRRRRKSQIVIRSVHRMKYSCCCQYVRRQWLA